MNLFKHFKVKKKRKRDDAYELILVYKWNLRRKFFIKHRLKKTKKFFWDIGKWNKKIDCMRRSGTNQIAIVIKKRKPCRSLISQIEKGYINNNWVLTDQTLGSFILSFSITISRIKSLFPIFATNESGGLMLHTRSIKFHVQKNENYQKS